MTQAGLFDTKNLARDAALGAIRRAPKLTFDDLKSQDPRHSGVVYKEAAGRPVRLNHGSIVEGSVDHGGIQPNYVVDLNHPRLQSLLTDCRALNRPEVSFKDRVDGVVRFVQETLVDGAYDAPAYLKLLAERRKQRANVTLGDYLAGGAGVCRENALLTHLGLLEAGCESEYLYANATQGTHREDHAVAIVIDTAGRQPDGEKYVVDSYNSNFHGFRLADLLRPGGSQSTDKRLPSSQKPPSLFGCSLKVASYPNYWIPVRALMAPAKPDFEITAETTFRVVRTSREDGGSRRP